MINVNVNGTVYQVATIAEARALAGVAPIETKSVVNGPATSWSPSGTVVDRGGRQWSDEANGECNRCGGSGRWSGMGDRSCFRCKGTGIAPGFKRPVAIEHTRPAIDCGQVNCTSWVCLTTRFGAQFAYQGEGYWKLARHAN